MVSVSAFAALMAQQHGAGNPPAGGGIEGLVEMGLIGEIASLRLTLLRSLREIAVAKLAEALARVQGAARDAEPEGADELGRVLARVLNEMGMV